MMITTRPPPWRLWLINNRWAISGVCSASFSLAGEKCAAIVVEADHKGKVEHPTDWLTDELMGVKRQRPLENYYMADYTYDSTLCVSDLSRACTLRRCQAAVLSEREEEADTSRYVGCCSGGWWRLDSLLSAHSAPLIDFHSRADTHMQARKLRLSISDGLGKYWNYICRIYERVYWCVENCWAKKRCWVRRSSVVK